MFARVATFEGGDADKIREVNEQRMQDGTMNPPAGVKSVLVLDDKQAGKRLFMTFFETREEIQEAEERFEQMGEEIPEEIRGKRVGVDVYEVVYSMEAAAAGAQP